MSFGQFFLDNIFLFLMLFAAIGGIIYFELQGRNAAGEKVSNARVAVLANDNGAFIDLRSGREKYAACRTARPRRQNPRRQESPAGDL